MKISVVFDQKQQYVTAMTHLAGCEGSNIILLLYEETRVKKWLAMINIFGI